MSRFFSKGLSDLVPYTPGEQLAGSFIKLNTNESPFPPSPQVISALSEKEVSKLNLYSDPTAKSLVDSIAEFYGKKSENVVVGNGSDEILAFAFHAYGEKGFICPEVTYGFYPVFASFFGVELKKIPMNDDLSFDDTAFYNDERNVIIANPNAQTGTYLSLERIEKLLNSNKNRLVIVDEAYIDFGGESAVSLIDKYDNLLVVQTFSKSRNLAGGRIGFAIGNKDLISELNTLRFSFNPYNVNRLSILAGTASMKDKQYFNSCTAEIIKARNKTVEEVKKLGFSCTDSLGNFVLIKHNCFSGEELYLKLRENGILVRYLGGNISDYIRVTIGNSEQMKTFIEKLKMIVGG